MQSPPAGRGVAVPQHVRHSGTEGAGFAFHPRVPRHRHRTARLHSDRRLDAGQFHTVPALLAAGPEKEQNPLHRPRIPRTAQSGAYPQYPARVVRHLRVPRRKAGSQAGKLPRAGRRGGHRLLQPQQSGMDMSHGRGTAHRRRTGEQVRRHRHRGSGLPLHGLPQTAGTAFRSALSVQRRPLYAELYPDDLRVEDIQLRRTAHRRRGDLRRAPASIPRSGSVTAWPVWATPMC